jgi:glycosyltransferase involved in cell wall biosynthesis
LMRRTTAAARFVLTPSEAAARDLERVLGIPRARLRVTPLAADLACRPPDTDDKAAIAAVRERFDLHGPYVFTAAGLDARKRVDLLLEAFAAAVADFPAAATLVVAGRAHSANTRIYPQYEDLARRLGVADRVRFTGWIDEATKIALYQGAAAAVTASIAEGFGLTVLEGMACGAPVIATHRSSLPEVAGDAALLVEPTVAAWRQALVRVLTDPALAEDLRGRGLARAAQFDWQTTAAATAAVYREALTGGGGR